MSDTKADATKKHFATRDFTDAGTERRFEAGKPIDADAGSISNYVAAGLASDKPVTADAKPA